MMTVMGKRIVASITALAVAVGLGVSAGLGLVVPSTPAGADPPLDCATGVIVAVDFSPWSNTLNSVCDPALPANGVLALQNAGFALTGVSGYGLQFICQIDDDPPGDSCTSTPPATAYWSLWYAEAGQSTWTYSQQGAEGLEPQPGSIEAWVFGGATGAGQPPIPTPTTLDSSPTTTTTTESTQPPTQATAPAGPASAPVGVSAGSSPDSSEAGATGSQHATGSGTGTGARPSTTTSTTSDPGRAGASTTNNAGQTPSTSPTGDTSGRPSTGLKVVDAAPASATQPSTGSAGPFLIGAVMAALLAGSGGLIAWRRRRAG
jgi:LPXTG-motif cell wall-anchored protein